jgi:outer membrane receptor protein involved in Fe transport
VNTIPAALIDHVDIVTGGASAVYGSDAVTGVVNFVLKKELHGLILEGTNNVTARGDGASRSADLVFGTSFLGGRGNVIASIGGLRQDSVLQGDRPLTAHALSDGCIIKGSADRFGVGDAISLLPCEDDEGEPGLFRAGSSTIPAGSIRGSLLLPQPDGSLLRSTNTRFTPEGGLARFNPATDAYDFASENYLQVPLKRISGNLLGSVHLSDAFEPYTELTYVRTQSPQQLAPAPGFLGGGQGTVPQFQINLDNPFLSDQARQALDTSFGVDAEGDRGFIRLPGNVFVPNPAYGGDADGMVAVSGIFNTRLTGLGPRQSPNDRHAYRALVGARGQLTRALDYDAYFSTSYVKHEVPLLNGGSALRLQQAILAREDPATGQITCIDPSDGCVPINLFGVQDVSPEAKAFIASDAMQQTIVKEQIAEAVVRGPLFDLPAGAVRMAVGANWRRTAFDYMPDRSLELGDNLGYLPSAASSGETRVIELFAESFLPILADRRFARELSADLGLRYSHYDSVGGVVTWKAMGSWSPAAQLRLRGGWQRAVRAPNVRELYEEAFTDFGGGLDPCDPAIGLLTDPQLVQACIRNGAGDLAPNGTGVPLVRTAGSPDVKAETARTFTLGAVMQPWRSLAISVDYYEIGIRDAIGIFGGGATAVVFGCLLGGGDPADPLCQSYQRDETGAISFMDQRTANLPEITARGVDWQLSTTWPLFSGNLSLNLSGTHLLELSTQPNVNTGKIDCAGYFGNPCGSTIVGTAAPRWKLDNRASWKIGPATFSLRHRYFSATRDARFTAVKAWRQSAAIIAVPGVAEHLDARHYFDAALAFDIDKRFAMTLGVNNLANTRPALVGDQQIQANTDPSLYDVLGRRFFASLRAHLH